MVKNDEKLDTKLDNLSFLVELCCFSVQFKLPECASLAAALRHSTNKLAMLGQAMEWTGRVLAQEKEEGIND